MFLPEVLPVFYWDKFCIYMPLTWTVASLISPDFLCIPSAFLLKHSRHCMQSIRPSKMYALSKSVSVNKPDTVPIYGMSCSFSSDLRFCWRTWLALFLSCNGYGLYPFPCIWYLHDVFDISHKKTVWHHLITVLKPVTSFYIYIRKWYGIVINTCVCFLISMFPYR